MYCPYLKGDCYSGINCVECSCFVSYWNKINHPIQPFNYECPDCHGKFMTPAYVNDGSSAFSWRCPFCGRKLEGLN